MRPNARTHTPSQVAIAAHSPIQHPAFGPDPAWRLR
jgi:hypothetical protein